MTTTFEGEAIVYCEGALDTTNGKTAHGLIRRSRRYRVLSVIDSKHAGRDASAVMGDPPRGIPVSASLSHAQAIAEEQGIAPTHLVIGLAPDGGRLPPHARQTIRDALENGLHVVCGLHDFLGEDEELAELARSRGVQLIDVRRPPRRDELHFFSGKIEEVDAFKIAILGSDSAIGKRTTAWLLVEELERRGIPAQLVGTGQTAWLQGARHSIVMDSIVNDFVAGEIEHAVWSAWKEESPEVIVIEGQGSLMNPAYPGGFEILAAGRPDCVVLQHAPGRLEYDGFPGYRIHPLEKQIAAVELISSKPVVAVTINAEGIAPHDLAEVCRGISLETGLETCAPLQDGVEPIIEALLAHRDARRVPER